MEHAIPDNNHLLGEDVTGGKGGNNLLKGSIRIAINSIFQNIQLIVATSVKNN